MNILGTLLLCVAGQDRLVVIHDGNYHDKDDIGAVAMVEALMWKSGVDGTIIYNDHVGASDPAQGAEMIISATGGLGLFDLQQQDVFDAVNKPRESLRSLVQSINASSATNRLTIIQGGPWEFMAQAFDRANASKHQYVHIISHSDWNDDHEHIAVHRNKDDFYAQYAPGGKFQAFIGPAYEKITDQNGYAFKSSLSQWQWLVYTPQTQFVLDRTLASDYAVGDMSDAGMMYYYLTGDQTPSMNEVADYFGN